MRRVDAHTHVGLGLDEAALMRSLDDSRMDACWVLSWEEIEPAPWPYEELGVEAIAELHGKYPERVIPMYAPDPRRPDAGERLRSWVARGFRGCAELKTPLGWHSAEVQALLATVAELDLPVVFHMEVASLRIVPLDEDGAPDRLLARVLQMRRLGAVPHRWLNRLAGALPPLRRWRERRSYRFPGYLLDFASLADTLERFPTVPFVAHGPMWWQHLAGDAAADGPEYPRGPVRSEGLACRFLERFPNLHADLSGASGLNALERDLPFARRFLERFSDKLLYGTDNHAPGRLAALLESLDLSPRASRRIFGDNAQALVAG